MRSLVSRALLLCLLTLLLAGVAIAAPADARVHIGAGASYGYWAPQIHEMYLKLPVKADPIGGNEVFAPQGVTVDGKRPAYVFWYVNGHTIDFDPARQAGSATIAAYIPITWRANERHEVVLRYSYGGQNGEAQAVISTPTAGGAWEACTGSNQAFLIREEVGLARQQEPVELEVTIPIAQFPDPERGLRATVMSAPGVFREIPCQVYEIERYSQNRAKDALPEFIRFRAVVQISAVAKSQTLVHLWACGPQAEGAAVAGPLRLDGTALGGTVTNAGYAIELSRQSGQLYRWQDTRLKTLFCYTDPRKGQEGNLVVIHRTPDIFRTGAQWSHAFEWDAPENRAIAGPVMVETLRWGTMPWAPEIFSRVSYRFFANRPDIRVASSMRVTQDLLVMAFRNGNMIFGRDLFTHIAWPDGQGKVTRVAITDAYGNDMGAPPQARFPVNTPWVAFYHREKKVGMALVTGNLAYFSESPEHPNQSRPVQYASFYRGYFVYAIRSLNQTYCANVQTYPTPMHAGTVVYEDVAYLPFSFARENAKQFQPVEALLKELRNPLVIVP